MMVAGAPKSERGNRTVAIPPDLQDGIWDQLVEQGIERNPIEDMDDELLDRRLYPWRPDSLSKRFHCILTTNANYWDFRKHKRIAPEVKTFQRAGCVYTITEVPIKPFRLYDLRHFHASSLLSEGFSDKYASLRLGHDISILRKNYQHLFEDTENEMDNQAVDLMIKTMTTKPLPRKDRKP